MRKRSAKTTVKSTEATTAMKKDTDESVSVQAESNESDNLKTQDAESGSPTVTEVSLDDYINTSASGIWITINGQKETLEDIQKNNIKVPKGSPVEIKLEYGAISNLTENTKLSLTAILNDTKKQLSNTVQETRKKIRTCAWISITAVILCATLCALAVLWSR